MTVGFKHQHDHTLAEKRNLLSKLSLSRRSLLRSSLVLASSLSLGALLVACADEEDADEVGAGPDSTDEENDVSVTDDETPDEEEVDEEPNDGDDTDEAPIGDRGEVRIGLAVDANSFDPRVTTDSTGYMGAYMTHAWLIRIGEGTEPGPWLADSWEIEDDRIYIFHLNPDAVFHDGTPVEADDVEFTYDTTLDPALGSPFSEPLSSLENIEIIDEHTISFEFPEPLGPGIINFSMSGVVSKNYVEATGDQLQREPMGCGPYRLVEWQPNDRLVFEAFDDYFGGTPAFDQVIFRVIPEDSVRNLELEASGGAIDVNFGIAPGEIPDMEASDEVNAVPAATGSWAFLAFRADVTPFDDIRVRQAMLHAINRDEIVEAVWEGFAEPIYASLEPVSWAYPHDGIDDFIDAYPYDPERSRELLEEAGYPDGFTISQMTRNDSARTNLNLVVQSQLAEIGVITELESFDGAVGLERQRAGNYEVTASWLSDRVDPDEILFFSFHTSSRDLESSQNYWYYSNEEVDELLEQARSTVDPDERASLYEQALRIIYIEDAAMAPLSYARSYLGSRPDLEGVTYSRHSHWYEFVMNGRWAE